MDILVVYVKNVVFYKGFFQSDIKYIGLSLRYKIDKKNSFILMLQNEKILF